MHELALGHTVWYANGSDLNQTHGVFQQCTCPVMCQSTTENHLFVDPFWKGFLAKFETQVSMFYSILDVLQHWSLKTSSTIAGLQDFQKSYTVQILCTFYGMKT
ncbi:hypothetical protein GIB67_004561, partial [Kingdonia uniflora]